MAGDAGFEPTSPAPKAGRISRLPQSPNSIQMASLFEGVGAKELHFTEMRGFHQAIALEQCSQELSSIQE